jgi:hypothetical protein
MTKQTLNVIKRKTTAVASARASHAEDPLSPLGAECNAKPVRRSAARILCVGDDARHLATRCAVLSVLGFVADYALPEEAPSKVKNTSYELVIFSSMLSEAGEECRRAGITGNAKVLVLQKLILPTDLHNIVEEALRHAPLLFPSTGARS